MNLDPNIIFLHVDEIHHALNFATLVFSMKKSTEEKTKNVEVIAEVQGPQVLPVM